MVRENKKPVEELQKKDGPGWGTAVHPVGEATGAQPVVKVLPGHSLKIAALGLPGVG